MHPSSSVVCLIVAGLSLIQGCTTVAPGFVDDRSAAPAGFHPVHTLTLWPGGAPAAGEGAATQAVHAENMEVKQEANTGPYQWATYVSNPTMAVFLPSKEKANGAAMIICPGGGYSGLSMDKEGYEFAHWLNERGIAGVVLKYRVPNNRDGAFADIQRAMRLTRLRAAEWNISADKIGVMGFSAGAHLSARLSDNWVKATYPPIDYADTRSLEPSFVMLIYPGGIVIDNKTGKLDPRTIPNARTPATFIVQTYDDPVHVENSIAYFAALKQAGVKNCEMHIYSAGGHGYGLRAAKNGKFISGWPGQAEQWLETIGVLH